jgi:NADPH-dependent ferric siderophore reductase
MTRIQLNAVLVLESIGDARALPALEKLLSTTRNQFLARTISDAILAIKDKRDRAKVDG